MPQKQMKLTSFYFPPGAHATGWRMPDAIPESDMGFKHYVHLAQSAERGKMDCVFFQDTAAVGRSEGIGRRDKTLEGQTHVARLEPFQMLPGLAMLTKHIGLVATGTTTYNEPFHIARRYATLDHISNGRAGWNLVTSQIEDEAWNFGLDAHVDHGLRYERASEFYDVVVGLWDSWDADAVLRDKASGRYYDPAKVHVLDHKGRFFKVRGPLNVARCPQGRPVVAQAGSSEPGRELAARTAEVVFTAQRTLAEAKAFYADLKGRMAKYGRHPDHLKIMPGFIPVIGRTDEEARERYEHMQSLISDDVAVGAINRLAGGLDLRDFPIDGPLPPLPPSNSAKARQEILLNLARQGLSIRECGRRFAEGSGHRLVYGSPKTLADTMQEWLEEEGADGFTMLWPYFPTPVDDFTNLVVPELQRRGIFRTEYEGRNFRENLGIPIPQSAHALQKRAG
jgi:FMN-dependent oxidoreductase (nitrilotriacetate monooxygenase family)